MSCIALLMNERLAAIFLRVKKYKALTSNVHPRSARRPAEAQERITHVTYVRGGVERLAWLGANPRSAGSMPAKTRYISVQVCVLGLGERGRRKQSGVSSTWKVYAAPRGPEIVGLLQKSHGARHVAGTDASQSVRVAEDEGLSVQAGVAFLID